MTLGITLAERGLLPQRLVRFGIRRLLEDRLRSEAERAPGSFLEEMRRAPVALVPEAANAQHYEVPAAFYRLVLGRQLKYSSGLFEPSERGEASAVPGATALDRAEERMLRKTAENAALADGQRILELGCGWGSLTLWMARSYPNARIVGVSNSRSQRQAIEERARAEGLENVQIVTADMNAFEAEGTFDRVVSVEMFEHMRNWSALLGRIRRWVRDDGRLFLHVFSHRAYAYPFEAVGDDDWMGKNFFTGGLMPSVDLLDRLSMPFVVESRELISGTHYARTAEAWLENLDRSREMVLALFRRDLGDREAKVQLERWRIFFLSCAELFGYANGTEWLVAHHRLAPTVG